MPIIALRAKQSTDTTGTGTIALNPPPAAARSFADAFGAAARRIPYIIAWSTGFEVGLGDFNGASPGSLTRASVLRSSNANALVSLPAGTKDVFPWIDPQAQELLSIASGYTATLADIGSLILFTGSSAATLALPAVASVPPGAGFAVQNTGTASLTVDPAGAETVDGAAAVVVPRGASYRVVSIATGWVRAGALPGASLVGAGVMAAVDAAAARAAIATVASAGFRNLLVNPNFAINQRGYASGTATTAAGQYTLDCWRVVTAGQSLAYAASGNGNQVTVPTGGLEQVVEGANIAGGSHVLGWAGTATATVNGTARTKGEVFTLTANADATIRFANGTLAQPQLELSPVITAFEPRPLAIEQLLCARYFINPVFVGLAGYQSASGQPVGLWIPFPVRMRTTPTLIPGGSPAFSNVSSETLDYVTASGFRYNAFATAAGSVGVAGRSYAASADF